MGPRAKLRVKHRFGSKPAPPPRTAPREAPQDPSYDDPSGPVEELPADDNDLVLQAVTFPRRKARTAAPIFETQSHIFFLCFFVRFASAMLMTTEFVPDEAWQATEVAHYVTYGEGHLTWEWTVGLRSYIYPLFITGIFKVLYFIGEDTPAMLVMAPRIVQAAITALGDYCLYLYCCRRYGQVTAVWVLKCALTCWFNLYTGARMITNTVEMSLNAIAMYLLELDYMGSFSAVVALNFVIRPTAIMIWVPQAHVIFRKFFPLVPRRIPLCILTGLGTLVAAALVDWKMYGKPVLPWLRFFKFNVLEGKSAMFGVHHPLWYFYSAFPCIVGPNLLILIAGLYFRSHNTEWFVIYTFTIFFSCLGHKEIRFLLPVMPYVFVVMGDSLFMMEVYVQRKYEEYAKKGVDLKGMFRHLLYMSATVHLFAAVYFLAFHQGGVKPSTDYVNNASQGIANPEIWAITPCYSVPVFTYMHNPQAHFEFMTCGPPDMGLETKMPNFRRYTTKPEGLRVFVKEKLTEGIPLPNFILCFDDMAGKLQNVFREVDGDYQVCHTQVHAHFGDDRGRMHVLCKRPRLFSYREFYTEHLQDETVNPL